MKLYERTDRGLWYVDFQMPDGKRRRVSTEVKVTGSQTDQAKAMEAAGEIVRLAMLHASSDGITIAATRCKALEVLLERTYQERWKGGKSEYTMRKLVARLSRQVGHWPLNEVSYTKLQNFCQRQLDEGKKPATVNRQMTCIGTALTEAHKRGEISILPSMPHFAEKNKKDRYISAEEDAAITFWFDKQCTVEAMLDEAHDMRMMRDLYVFLLDTGCRFSEAFKFTVADGCADLTNADSKGGKGRRVPLTKRALQAAERLPSYATYGAFAGTEQTAREMARHWGWAAYRFGLATQACEITGVTLHTVRHTCASRLFQKGVDIYTVSKWLGHASITTTERYTKLATDGLRAALARLETEVEPSHGTGDFHKRDDQNGLGTVNEPKLMN